MARSLAKVAMVVGAVAAVVVTAGAAAPLVGATMTTFAGVSMATWTAVAAAASVTSAVIGMSAGTGFSAQGNPTEFHIDPNAPLPYVMGRTISGGYVVYRRDHTSPGSVPNDRLTDVVIYSAGGPVQGYDQWRLYGNPITFAGNGAGTGDYANYLWMKSQLGATPEASALSTADTSGTAPPQWTSASKLSGYAAAMFTSRFDSDGKRFPQGEPTFSAVLRGVKVYDPRQDSTYPGGSGPCRPLQENTYVYSENPYLHALTWLLGRWQNGKRVIGVGVPLRMIDVPAFVNGANVADANNWKIGGVAYSTDGKWETLKRILQAGGGYPTKTGAIVSCTVNAPVVSLDTLRMEDLSGGIEITATQGRRQRINSVIPRYRSEAHNWEVVSADPIDVGAHIVEDGGEVRREELDLPFVQNVNQAAQLGRYRIDNSREFAPINVTLKTRWVGFKPGDAITLHIPEVGLNNQLCVITERGFSPESNQVQLTLRSETTAKHAFCLGQTGVAPPIPTLSGPPIIPTPAALDWSISATSIQDGDYEKPALVVSGAMSGAQAQEIWIEFREYSPGMGDNVGWVSTGASPYWITQKVITSVLPQKQYQVGISYVQYGARGARLILGPVTTGEDSAMSAAEAALLAAQNAESIADGKIASYYQPNPPTGADLDIGDLWFDTDDGNRIYTYGGLGLFIAGTQVDIAGTRIDIPWMLAADQRVGQALDAAAGAQATADGKVTTFYSESAPTAEALGDLWYQPSTQVLKRWNGSAWVDTATRGAPAGTDVAGQPATTVASVAVNFNARNDRNGAAIIAPTVLTDGTAVDHTINTDGSADISFEWVWSGTNADIDGFAIYVYSSTSASAYTFGTDPAGEQVFYCPADKRAFIMYGTPANKYYTFGVRAYRIVDPDVNAAGIIQTAIIKSTRAEENPYRPSANVAFAGNITGTVAGTPATTIVNKTQNLTDGGQLGPNMGIQIGVLRSLGNGVSIVSLRDGDTFTFPADWGAQVPGVVGMMNGMVSGTEFILSEAVGLTSAGFTAKCKRVTAVSGRPTVIPAAATPSSPRVYEKIKPNADLVFNDRFTFKFDVLVTSGPIIAPGERLPGTVTLGFWTYDGLTWQMNSTASWGSGATEEFRTYIAQTVTVSRAGMGLGSRFGISIVSSEHGGGVTAFTEVSYQAVTSVTETSATPPRFPGINFLIIGGAQVA